MQFNLEGNMNILRALQSIRNDFLDAVMSVITLLGEETFFMIAAMVVMWCISKKWGFRLMLTGLVGNTLNQLLKAIFLIPRPWVLDPSFEIVESAREAASGYSFPSGHTQSAANVFGTFAAWSRKKWVAVVCTVMVLLVGFSRNYLGVHTPLDVVTSIVTGLVTIVVMTALLDWAEKSTTGKIVVRVGSVLFMVVLILYMTLAPVREANMPEIDAHNLKTAWTLLGSGAGIVVAWWVDEKKLHFPIDGVWWAQVLKIVIGMALIMGVRLGMKPVLAAIFGDQAFTSAIRYFLMVMVGGILWPMTFRFWAKVGQKQK